MSMPDVFISYSHKDKNRRDQVADLLTSNNVDVWVDNANMQPGDWLYRTIFPAIERSKCLLVIYTKHTPDADWTWREIDHAAKCGIPVLVISFGEVIFPEDRTEWLGEISRVAVPRVFSQKWKNELLQFVRRTVDAPQCPVITMLNVKGGVGKTVLTANLFGCMHEYEGKSVLLIDFDPQHNLTQLILDDARMARAEGTSANVMSLFRGFGETNELKNAPPSERQVRTVATRCRVPLKELPDPRGIRIDMVPGSFHVITYFLNGESTSHIQSTPIARNLKYLIDHFRTTYDLIAIDVNPGASIMTKLALINSTHVLAPVRPDRFAKHGLSLLDLLLDRLDLNPENLTQLAIMNGVKRGEQEEVERGLREKQDFDTKWRRKILAARIAHSKRLIASPAPPALSDLTANLAYHGGLGSNAIRTDLKVASEELVSELGL